MAKRFTDTEKWKDEWWGLLSNDYRMIWLYLVDSCSIAGIWKKDFRGLNFNCNTNISEKEFLQVFGSRLVDRGNFYFIPKFLRFQCPKGLNSNKPAIVSIVKELEQNNLTLIVIESLGNDFLIIKGKDKGKGEGKDKGKGKEGFGEIDESNFETIGKPNGHRITIKAKYLHERPKIVHDLQEYFRRTDQLEAIQMAGWLDFEGFMKANPGRMFEADSEVYHSFKKHCTKPKENGITGTKRFSKTTTEFSGDYSSKL